MASSRQPRPPTLRYLRGWVEANQRSLVKRHIKARVPQHRNNPDYQKNRYQGISLAELNDHIAGFRSCLGRFHGLRAAPVAEHIYSIGG